jgi:hypothetical protein
MAIFTAFVLAAFVSYAGAWYMGMYDGNFALLLFTATLVTGLYWLAERFYFLPQRLAQAQALGLIEYIPFPDALRGKYQCFTQADLGALRGAGCDHVFADVQTGVTRYMQWLAHNA